MDNRDKRLHNKIKKDKENNLDTTLTYSKLDISMMFRENMEEVYRKSSSTRSALLIMNERSLVYQRLREQGVEHWHRNRYWANNNWDLPNNCDATFF